MVPVGGSQRRDKKIGKIPDRKRNTKPSFRIRSEKSFANYAIFTFSTIRSTKDALRSRRLRTNIALAASKGHHIGAAIARHLGDSYKSLAVPPPKRNDFGSTWAHLFVISEIEQAEHVDCVWTAKWKLVIRNTECEIDDAIESIISIVRVDFKWIC